MNDSLGAVTSQQSLRTLDSVESAVAAARSITPQLRARCEQIESDRMVSGEVIALLAERGLFGLVGARSFGGSEVGIEALVRVTIEIASACGSAGWVYGVLAGHSWMLNLFPEQAQRELARVPGSLTATVFRLSGKVVPERDGFRLTNGVGRFCSGIDHADWVLVGGSVQREGGPAEQRFLLVPRNEIEIVDDWFTVGMRGTGSRSIRIANSFIPGHRSVALKDMVSGTTPGAAFHGKPIYQMSFAEVTPYSIVGAPLGMARAAVSCFAEGLKKGLDAGGGPASQEALFLRLGRAAAEIDAAIAIVLADTVRVDRLKSPQDLDDVARRELPRNWSWAVQTCRAAVNDLYEASGGSVIYDNAPMQRVWRDINSAAQHMGFSADKPMIDYSKVRMGLKPDAYVIPKTQS